MARNTDLAYDPPEMGSSGVGDVGRLLRDARETAGMDLRDVADRLRIRYMYLEAIEDGRYGDLPGATYAVGFIRAYADLLGLDQHEVARRFKQESDSATTRSDLVFPVPVNEGGLPSAAVLLVAALLGSGVYGFWYWASSDDRSVVEVIQEVPERLMSVLGDAVDGTPLDGLAQAGSDPAAEPDGPPVSVATKTPEPVALETAAANAPLPAVAVAPTESEAPGAPAVSTDSAAPAAPEPDAPLAALPSAPTGMAAEEPMPPVEQHDVVSVPPPEEEPPEEELVAEAPAPVEETPDVVAETAASEPVPEPTPAVPAAPPAPELSEDTGIPVNGRSFGEENLGARVVLRARADAWVQVREGDELLLTRLLRRGDSYRVPNRPGLTLMTGNAGGIVVEVDGVQVPPLGRTGEVKRGIPLDVETLQATAGSTN